MGRIPNGHPRTGGHPSAGVPGDRCRSLVRRYDQTRFCNGEPIGLRKVADLRLSTSSHDDLKKNGAACLAAPVRFRARPRGAWCKSFRTCLATASHERDDDHSSSSFSFSSASSPSARSSQSSGRSSSPRLSQYASLLGLPWFAWLSRSDLSDIVSYLPYHGRTRIELHNRQSCQRVNFVTRNLHLSAMSR